VLSEAATHGVTIRHVVAILATTLARSRCAGPLGGAAAVGVNLTTDHIATAESLVAEAHANDGLAPVDLDRFWADHAVSRADPFGEDIPQMPLGAICKWECVFEELDIPQQWERYQQDAEWRRDVAAAFNDKSERIVGRRLLHESASEVPRPAFPAVKQLHEVFEMENRWDPISQSWWLHPSVSSSDELRALLDRVDGRLNDFRAFLLPQEWDDRRAGLLEAGARPPAYRGQRGPVTFATSMVGAQELVYLIADDPDLATRLSDTILRAMLGKIRVQDEEAGHTPETAPRGFSFADDNCALLNAEMYDFFAYPIVKGVWDVCSPDPADRRYQHSDSDMAHIVPILARQNMTGVNFGPNVLIDTIREHMPTAVIEGVLAPFTYSRNAEVGIVAEFLRDFEMAREERGGVFATAGSINNGSRLTGMRLIISAIQRYGRYDA
jgi:uroporphyrinogen decarboxylase